LLGRRQVEAEMTEEMWAHIGFHARELERGGLSAEEAMRRARADFGSVEGTKEAARQALGLRLWDEVRGDLRQAARLLRRAPGYAATAIITLALGIGATTTIFSVINGVLLRPLPFAESDRLVQVAVYPNGALALYQDAASFEAIGLYSWAGEMSLLSDGLPERVRGRSVSVGFFNVLRLQAQHGRVFRTGEDAPGAAEVVLVSDGLWRRRFGADPGLVGRTVVVDGRPREVVGILPRGFNFPVAGTELWIPVVLNPATPIPLWNSTSRFIARLRPGVDLAAANAEHRALIPQVRDGFPWTMPDDFGTGAENQVRTLQEVMTASVRDRLLLVFGAVSLVLLVACANVANLNLTRMAGRLDEVAVRQALGGTRLRLARQLLVEQLVLSGVGAGIGVLLARAGVPLLVRWLPPDTARLDQVAVDGRVLLFTALAAIAAGVLATLGPILRVPADSVGPQAGAIRTGPPWRSLLSGGLVVAQVALAVTLVIGAGLLLRSLGVLVNEDPGVRVERLVSAKVSLDRSRCTSQEVAPGQWELPASCRPFQAQLDGQLAATPGLGRFALASAMPLEQRGGGMAMHVEDHPRPPSEPAHWLEQQVVTPEYFALMGIEIEEGRPLTADDRAFAPSAVVISRAVADRYWPGISPIGKEIRPVWLPIWWTVVGVAADVPPADRATEPALDFYSPMAQEPREEFFILAETGMALPEAERALREALRRADPTVPLSQVRTLREVRAATAATPRVTSLLLGAFALLALVLGAIGVYGVLSYDVTRRRREIGIRMAVGAGAGAVRGLVLRRAGRLITLGVAIGLLAAWYGSALLRGFLYGIDGRDPAAYLGAVGLFVVVGLVAAFIPARRATRVTPTTVLRDG